MKPVLTERRKVAEKQSGTGKEMNENEHSSSSGKLRSSDRNNLKQTSWETSFAISLANFTSRKTAIHFS